MYFGWRESRLSQEEAARVLGVCDRTFRRYVNRYEEMGAECLSDKRLTQASFRRAPVDEVMALMGRYESRYRGWNVKHFFSWYRRDGGQRSYSWLKNTLQSSGLVTKVSKGGVHRKHRERSLLPGMMLHQDGSKHECVPGKKWDLIVTMDDATNEHYSMFLPKSRYGFLVADNLLDQRFSADDHNKVWASYIPFIWTRGGWPHTAATCFTG